MIAFSSVNFLLGPIMLGLAGLMLIPCFVAWYIGSPDLAAFLKSELATAAFALFLLVQRKQRVARIRVREMFLFTALAWLFVCLFGALPFLLSHTAFGFTNAMFESVSAATTTGATILSGLDELPADILLWRSMLQWIGGIGIVAVGAAILPFLRIGGMRLFHTESSDLSEKALPHTRRILSRLLVVYLLLSGACCIAYVAAGMTWFDAINHSMTTVSTGGFSTHDASIAWFDSVAIEMVGAVFMLLAAAPFMLYLPMLAGNFKGLLQDGQVRSMLLTYLYVAALLVGWLVVTGQGDFGTSTRLALFNVISIATTTGYASTDYTAWGTLAIIVFFFLTYIGGCSGSTSGGIKIFRFKIAFVMLYENIQRLLHPNAVTARSMQGRPISDDILASVMAFALAFAFSVGIIAVVLAADGNDFMTSFSGAVTSMANVGPGVGDKIGPTGNFAGLSDISKWTLCFGMLLGRLEIFTILVLLTPTFWRD